jgi:NADH:ubiquinone oxidoreductase subunit K
METNVVWLYDLLIVAVIFLLGFICLVAMRNVVKLLIGIEVLAKGVSLALIASGHVQRNPYLMQSVVITLIVIEVVFVAVALALIVNLYRRTGSLDIRKLTKLKW